MSRVILLCCIFCTLGTYSSSFFNDMLGTAAEFYWRLYKYLYALGLELSDNIMEWRIESIKTIKHLNTSAFSHISLDLNCEDIHKLDC